MSSNENEIGVKAVFDISKFIIDQQKYIAALEQANNVTSKFASLQADANSRIAASEKRLSDKHKETQDEIVKTSRASAEKQSINLRQMERMYQQAITSIVFLFAGIAAAYKILNDEAKRLGDEEAIAGFTAMETATTNLSDSFAAMLLEAVPIGDALKFIAGGFTTLGQVVTIVGAALTWWFTNLFGGLDILKRRLAEMSQGQIFSGMDVGREFSDLNARANAAADRVIIASVQAPEKVASTKAAEEAEKKRLEDAKKAEEKRLQLIADYAQKHKDMIIKSGEDILSAEVDLQAKSASAWADYMSKSADIIAKGIEKRAELLSAYTDAIASAESEYQLSSEDASYQHGLKLQDIERNYQNTIRQIQEDFGTEALDAVRNLDAIGFRRAQEKRDAAIMAAGRSRDEANSAEEENYSQKLYELQRALEDEKREAERAYRRGLDEQRRAEAEAQAAAKAAYNAQLNDARNAFNTKLGAIQAAYTAEDNAARAHYLNQEIEYAAHLARMAALLAQYGIGTSKSGGSGVRKRASGGLDMVSSPTQFIAGEAGPEMVLTMPLNRNVPMPMTQVVNHTGDFSHQIDSTIRSSVAGIDGRITAAVTKALREVLG